MCRLTLCFVGFFLFVPQRLLGRWMKGGTKKSSSKSITTSDDTISKTESEHVKVSNTAEIVETVTPTNSPIVVVEEELEPEPAVSTLPIIVVEEEEPPTAAAPPVQLLLEEPNNIPLFVTPTTDPPLPTNTILVVPKVDDRSEVAASGVDLSGDWTIMVSDEFKAEYDEYLKQLGQPMLVRSIALGIIGMTTEYTLQTNEGRELFIRGTNARGVWERSLTANNRITTADSEVVDATSWWEDNGISHRSWLKGVTKYGGGDFESKRYLDPQNPNVLVTESTFHPADPSRGPVKVTWRFLRKNVDTTNSSSRE